MRAINLAARQAGVFAPPGQRVGHIREDARAADRLKPARTPDFRRLQALSSRLGAGRLRALLIAW
jgi:hypothetical protein